MILPLGAARNSVAALERIQLKNGMEDYAEVAPEKGKRSGRI